MPSIPATIPVFSVIADDVDDVLAEHQNTPNDEITNLATFLGMMGTGKTQAYGTDILAMLCNAEPPLITKASSSQITVGTGVVWVKNSAQSNRMPRRNTSTVSVTASNIDTGSMAVGYYYLYAVADSTGTTFTVKFSTSATTPTGLTNYELIGWFYNETAGALDITSGMLGGVIKNGRFPTNGFSIIPTRADQNTSSTSYVDVTGASLRFYSTGRPVKVSFFNNVINPNGNGLMTFFTIDVDGTDYGDYVAGESNHSGDAYNTAKRCAFERILNLSSGSHTIKIQWKVASGTAYMNNSTNGADMILNVQEI